MLLIELERSLSRLKPDGISFREKCKFGTLHRSVTTRVGDGEVISDLCASTLALGPFHYPFLPTSLHSSKLQLSYRNIQFVFLPVMLELRMVRITKNVVYTPSKIALIFAPLRMMQFQFLRPVVESYCRTWMYQCTLHAWHLLPPSIPHTDLFNILEAPIKGNHFRV